MGSVEEISKEIRTTGFRCTGCGNCCRCFEKDSNLVILSPREVRSIIQSCGLAWDNVVEPYPEIINNPGGSRYTLMWSLLREDGNCRFLIEGLYSIYANRPWICRTYPFMLDEDNLVVSECDGLGQAISDQEANMIARTLLERRHAEEEEERRVRNVLQKSKIPPDTFVVIDTEGMRVIES